jgi:ankyrin repeat protein
MAMTAAIRRSSVACLLVAAALAAPLDAAEALLADAAEQRNTAAIGALLAQKANVNAPQADGMTALHWAVYHEDLDLAKRLIAAGAEVGPTNRYGVTPLSIACQSGAPDLVELLLDAGADANEALPGGETPLMTASRTGRLPPVAALLARGAKVDAREHNGQTALMWAAAEGHVEVVDALLNAGAEFRKPLKSGFTPLFFAAREGRTAVVLRLLEAGLDVNEPLQPAGGAKANSPKETNALLLAVENGHFETAVALLEAGADPNAQPGGYTALHAMTWVRKPIRGDGDPPPTGSGQLTSLDFVRRLAAHGADVNARLKRGTSGRGRFTTTGSTPFVLAARASDVPLLQLLLKLGADPKLPNVDDCPPLLAAAGVGALGDGEEAAGTEEEAAATVRLLLDLGADPDAVDKNGETAMHGAAYQSWPQVVELLADRGASAEVWNRKNKFGWTPLEIAQGHRPGNFRPAPDTIAAVEKAARLSEEVSR